MTITKSKANLQRFDLNDYSYQSSEITELQELITKLELLVNQTLGNWRSITCHLHLKEGSNQTDRVYPVSKKI